MSGSYSHRRLKLRWQPKEFVEREPHFQLPETLEAFTGPRAPAALPDALRGFTHPPSQRSSKPSQAPEGLERVRGGLWSPCKVSESLDSEASQILGGAWKPPEAWCAAVCFKETFGLLGTMPPAHTPGCVGAPCLHVTSSRRAAKRPKTLNPQTLDPKPWFLGGWSG